MSLTYATWKATIANETVITATDANFLQILPSCIDYAEQRIYRELDLLQTVEREYHPITAQQRGFDLATTHGTAFITTLGFNVITPAGSTPDGGTRNPLVPTTRDFLDMAWPDGQLAHCGLPRYYAMLTQTTILVGPWPDQNYQIETIGTVRPTPLSESNTTTFLTTYLPDLFVAASMIFMSGYMHNFGAQADDPKMAQSWQTQYDALFASANVEEQRKKYASGAWGSLQPTPLATANR